MEAITYEDYRKLAETYTIETARMPADTAYFEVLFQEPIGWRRVNAEWEYGDASWKR